MHIVPQALTDLPLEEDAVMWLTPFLPILLGKVDQTFTGGAVFRAESQFWCTPQGTQRKIFSFHTPTFAAKLTRLTGA